MEVAPAFACGCLNIKIYPKPTTDSVENHTQHDPQATNDYVEVYVGESGIIVLYSELTLRSRSGAFVDAKGQKCQNVTVKCLACDISVYRIKTEVSTDMDAKEGPMLPSEDWAEHDILRSRTGWIEVYTGNGGTKDASLPKLSPDASRYFEVRLPDVNGATNSTLPKYLPQTRISIPRDHQFLPTIPEFLPQPPFTPSHPIFRRLASVASSKSAEMRQEVMDKFAVFAREQVAHLQEAENSIKLELELLWNKVGEGLRKAEDERDGKVLGPLIRRRSDSPTRIGGISSSLPVVSTMRGFAPSTYHGQRTSGRTSSPMHASNRSGLASSVAVTGFYHPRSRNEGEVRRTDAVTSINGGEPHTLLPSAYDEVPDTPSTLSSASSPSDDSVDLPDTLRRNMNEKTDISASLQVFSSVLEQEASKKRAQSETQKGKEKAKEVVKEDGLSPGAKQPGKPSPTSRKEGVSLPSDASTGDSEAQPSSAINGINKRERRRSGNKRVTFDVEPDVVTIKREVTSGVEDDTLSSGADDLIFELEDDTEAGPKPVNGDRNSLLEDDTTERSTNNIAGRGGEIGGRLATNSSGASKQSVRSPNILPESLSALRPASLPAPSHVRPRFRSRGNIPSSSRLQDDSLVSRNMRGKQGLNTFSNVVPRSGMYDQELRRLVGADMPSHRGSWSDNSDTWQRFQRGARASDSSVILEEDENGVNSETGASSWSDFSLAGVARSLPVPMAPLSQVQQQKQPAKPESSTALESEDANVPLSSATASRLKAYAERDIKREFDPGYMDFLGGDLEGDEVDVSLQPDANGGGHVSQSRSREQAFQILEARNKLPAEGMWRSLAS